MLRHFYTDICATKGLPKHLRRVFPRDWVPKAVKALFDRVPEGVPEQKTTAFTTFGLHRALRQRSRSTLSEQTADYIWAGKQFGKLVTRNLSSDIEGVYAFKTAALEILEKYAGRDIFTVVEQPNVHRKVMHELLTEEHHRFPEWAESRENDEHLNAEIRREQAEWEHADLIVCPSEFVERGVRKGGGSEQKTIVVPYGVDFPARSSQRTRCEDRPLRVLTVGRVSLRKGAPYLAEAARRSDASVRAVGKITLRKEGREKMMRHIDLRGRVPRSQIHDHYEWADVFVLPSLCEGSATVVYEALANALPVICTPNTGSIVRDEVEGFIVPIRDGKAIADRLGRLRSDSSLYSSMSEKALRRYREAGDLDAYSSRLINAITGSFHRRGNEKS